MNKIAEIRSGLLGRIFKVTPDRFDALALDIFRYQAEYNLLYKKYLALLNKHPDSITERSAIPHLPITFFKTHTIKTGLPWRSDKIFTSSGTTGAVTSKHHVRNLELYNIITEIGFKAQYGYISDYDFLALLPSYLERKDSSLVAMADYFMGALSKGKSGFFLDNHDALLKKLRANMKKGAPTVLLGVTYALLDLCEHPALRKSITDPSLITVMETGGMKGRRKEMTRPEVHEQLRAAFGVPHIHSEYGMTELLSQAYAPRDGIFIPTPTMRVLATEINDPFTQAPSGRNGQLNITDLANIDSCAFIATEDVGRVYSEIGHFEVLGRLDVADMRGCNLMVE